MPKSDFIEKKNSCTSCKFYGLYCYLHWFLFQDFNCW